MENSERDGNTRPPVLPLEKRVCRSGTTEWFQIGKGVRQSCILSPCLFNLYAEYIMRNVGLEEAQAGIKITKRNINNHRYADDPTLMAESEEELKSLFSYPLSLSLISVSGIVSSIYQGIQFSSLPIFHSLSVL